MEQVSEFPLQQTSLRNQSCSLHRLFYSRGYRLHNDVNILALGGRSGRIQASIEDCGYILNTPFSNDEDISEELIR